jgi:hypothetical protein
MSLCSAQARGESKLSDVIVECKTMALLQCDGTLIYSLMMTEEANMSQRSEEI